MLTLREASEQTGWSVSRLRRAAKRAEVKSQMERINGQRVYVLDPISLKAWNKDHPYSATDRTSEDRKALRLKREMQQVSIERKTAARSTHSFNSYAPALEMLRKKRDALTLAITELEREHP